MASTGVLCPKWAELGLARSRALTTEAGLASEGLRHEIAAEAKSDGIHGVCHAVGNMRRDVDAETLELARSCPFRSTRSRAVAGRFLGRLAARCRVRPRPSDVAAAEHEERQHHCHGHRRDYDELACGPRTSSGGNAISRQRRAAGRSTAGRQANPSARRARGRPPKRSGEPASG